MDRYHFVFHSKNKYHLLIFMWCLFFVRSSLCLDLISCLDWCRQVLVWTNCVDDAVSFFMLTLWLTLYFLWRCSVIIMSDNQILALQLDSRFILSLSSVFTHLRGRHSLTSDCVCLLCLPTICLMDPTWHLFYLFERLFLFMCWRCFHNQSIKLHHWSQWSLSSSQTSSSPKRVVDVCVNHYRLVCCYHFTSDWIQTSL